MKRIYYIVFAVVGLVWLTVGACSIVKPAPVLVPVETVQPKPVTKPIKKPVRKPVHQKRQHRAAPEAPKPVCPQFDAICHLLNS